MKPCSWPESHHTRHRAALLVHAPSAPSWYLAPLVLARRHLFADTLCTTASWWVMFEQLSVPQAGGVSGALEEEVFAGGGLVAAPDDDAGPELPREVDG